MLLLHCSLLAWLAWCSSGVAGETTTAVTTTTATETTATTNMDDQYWSKAMDQDVGRYSTVNFEYQYYQRTRDDLNKRYTKDPYHEHMEYSKLNETCINSYIECVTSQVAPQPVCAFNDDYTFWSSHSYCDIYLNNCKRGYRVWRILGQGVCTYYNYVGMTRRRGLPGLLLQLLYRRRDATSS